MPRDPVGLIIFVAMTTMAVSAVLGLVVETVKLRSLSAPVRCAVRYAVGYAFTVGGVVVVWAASTIDAPVVPLFYTTLGVGFFGTGLLALAICKRASKKLASDKTPHLDWNNA
jgi:hypothetical protein